MDQKGNTKPLGFQQSDPLKTNSPDQAWDREKPDFGGLNNPNFVKEMQGARSWAGCCFNSPDSCLCSYRSLLPFISGIGLPLSPASNCPALRHVAVHSCHLDIQGG